MLFGISDFGIGLVWMIVGVLLLVHASLRIREDFSRWLKPEKKDQERWVSFEDWNLCRGFDLTRDRHGVYIDKMTRVQWEAWNGALDRCCKGV